MKNEFTKRAYLYHGSNGFRKRITVLAEVITLSAQTTNVLTLHKILTVKQDNRICTHMQTSVKKYILEYNSI